MNKLMKLSQQNVTYSVQKFIKQRYSRNRTLLNVAFEGSYKRNEYIYSNDYTAEIKIWFMAVHVDV